MNTTVSLPAAAQAVAPDRSALLAALSVTGSARTTKGHAFREHKAGYADARPFAVVPVVGLVTWHESPALAIARLVSL